MVSVGCEEKLIYEKKQWCVFMDVASSILAKEEGRSMTVPVTWSFLGLQSVAVVRRGEHFSTPSIGFKEAV